MGRHRRKPPETAAERVAFHDSHHQPPRATISRSWLDTLDLISMMLEHTPTNDRDATGYADHLAMAASEIMNREDTMDGPMPPDVEAFVHRYARPDA